MMLGFEPKRHHWFRRTNAKHEIYAERPVLLSVGTAVYVYCDLLEHVMVEDIKAPLLRIVNRKTDVSRIGDTVKHTAFNPIQYVPLQKKSFDTIDILLRPLRRILDRRKCEVSCVSSSSSSSCCVNSSSSNSCCSASGQVRTPMETYKTTATMTMTTMPKTRTTRSLSLHSSLQHLPSRRDRPQRSSKAPTVLPPVVRRKYHHQSSKNTAATGASSPPPQRQLQAKRKPLVSDKSSAMHTAYTTPGKPGSFGGARRPFV